MGADLIATVVPKLTEHEYQNAINAASAQTLAVAAFRSGYREDLGDDVEFAARATDMIADEDPSVIDQLAAHAGALDALRAAARNGAQYILKRARLGGAYVVNAMDLGGPDVIVVGGSTHGDDPFDEFRYVAVLAAILAAER